MNLWNRDDLGELHLLLNIIHHVDVGLVVVDRAYDVKIWNHFMWNHSGINPTQIQGKNLFEQLPKLPETWMRKKLDTVFHLNNRSFSTWQQRPYIFKFDSYKPITGRSSVMYQNMTIFPLASTSGEIEHACIMIYDSTDAALDEQSLHEANIELDRLGRTDGLTGLFNRRAWEERLRTEYTRFSRCRQSSVLVMFDIDHFKRVNDTYGHQAGDEVIRQVAAALTDSKRESDIAGRYGGEEFCVVLLDTDSKGGLVFAERLRKRIEALVVHYEKQEIRFTISLGLAAIEQGSSSPTEWLEQADQSLYHSKENGRNQTTVFVTADD